MLLTSRQLLQAKARDIENDLRGTSRNFGLKVGIVGAIKFEARIREVVANHPDLATIVNSLLVPAGYCVSSSAYFTAICLLWCETMRSAVD